MTTHTSPSTAETLRLSSSTGRLTGPAGLFDPWALTWTSSQETAPGDGDQVTPLEAVRFLAARGALRRVPVGVIGPKRAHPAQLEIAEEVGRLLARNGMQLLTGGRGGVMEAASRGAFEAGGQTIGIIPDDEWSTANSYVTIPLATGLGPARNAVVARACAVLIAIGGEYGTLSEMAFGMHFDRLVLALLDAPQVAGVHRCANAEEALDRAARRLLRLD